MNFEPQKFFIGVIDFFSVILPGAFIAYLAKPWIESVLFYNGDPNNTEKWAVFLFISYFLGHFIFFIGAQLDQAIYSRVIEAAKENEEDKKDQRVEQNKMVARFCKWVARELFSNYSELVVKRASQIKEQYIPDIDGKRVINAFQWSKARLLMDFQAALLEVQRFEADSKFFRSMLVVFSFITGWGSVDLAGWFLYGEPFGNIKLWQFLPYCPLLIVMSFCGYMVRRYKAIQQAYWYVITLETHPQFKKTELRP